MASGIAKYNGACKVCGKKITAGVDSTKWAPAIKGSARHFDCYGQVDRYPYAHYNMYSDTVLNGVDGASTAAIAATTHTVNNGSAAAAVAVAPVTTPVTPVPANVTLPKTDASDIFSGLASHLLPYIESTITAKVDMDAVKRELTDAAAKLIADKTNDAVQKALASHTKTLIIENKRTAETKTFKATHEKFELLLNVCMAHTSETPVNVWLGGPAGSGKTKAAEMVAEALGLTFYYTGAITEAYSLLGFKDANGKLVRTPFRECFENGGVFLWDEVDGSSPNALLAFNGALANSHCAFPDGVIRRHPDCIIIAAANTWGNGATNEYVGRLKLDAATLSRFVQIQWNYDSKLEKALTGNDAWYTRVVSVRTKVQSLGIKVLVTPRASYTGAALLANGISQKDVEEMVLRCGMTDAQWNQVKA